MTTTKDLISAIADADYANAETAFASIMANRVSDALDATRIEVAKSMFRADEEVADTEDNTEVEASAEEETVEASEEEEVEAVEETDSEEAEV